MSTVLAIINGLAAIPKLIEKVEDWLAISKQRKKEAWDKLSIEVERRLDAASTKEEIKQAAKDIQDLIRNMS